MNWKFASVLLFQFGVCVAIGKLISIGYHLNWLAASILFFAGSFAVACWRMYREASLSYFDSQSGTFKPRHSEQTRGALYRLGLLLSVALAGIGLIIQAIVWGKDAAALKILGLLHGAFGVWILSFLYGSPSRRTLARLTPDRFALKLIGSLAGAALLLLCAWASWGRPDLAALLALASLVAFVVTASSGEVLRHGLIGGFGRLMGTFYVAVAVRLVGAWGLWVLGQKVAALGS